jgi:energy-coupling factor transporter transmembrane protein EcfT
MALDVAVPPLSLLMIFITMGFVITTLSAVITNTWAPPALFLLSLGLILAGTLMSWIRYGRAIISIGGLLAAPAYVLWKVSIYNPLLLKGSSSWHGRTERDHDEGIND